MRFGVWEILLIIVLVLIIFGGSKLAGVGKSLGRGIKEFKEEIGDTDKKEETPETDGETPEEKTPEDENPKKGE